MLSLFSPHSILTFSLLSQYSLSTLPPPHCYPVTRPLLVSVFSQYSLAIISMFQLFSDYYITTFLSFSHYSFTIVWLFFHTLSLLSCHSFSIWALFSGQSLNILLLLPSYSLATLLLFYQYSALVSSTTLALSALNPIVIIPTLSSTPPFLSC